MTLSVIIVNYNVKFFLEQCLKSVFAASEGLDVEVWVVDNNSTDGSVQMVSERFHGVHLIANSDNPGFAKANNQALRQASGKYLLLLNPDTLVQRDTFTVCLDFFAQHRDCGGLSVKMVNGEGVFLKESKRGFPSPATSFFKISGLIRLFPHNRRIGAYYMGHLDEDVVNEVDVLPGAFLMISREAMGKVGLLDESYFMYGEDIDFSWRIRLAGYKNYYLPCTRILHYKGESTRKSTMNYVYTFYNAMAIFARKYFSGNGVKAYSLLIQMAIWLRASLDFVKRIVHRMAVPFLDFVVSLAGMLAIKQVWATYWAENVNYYPDIYTWMVIPLYVIVLLFASWLAGGYDKPVRAGRIAKGMIVGALCLLVFYSLLSEELRFSRAIVLLGSLWSMLAVMGTRGLLGMLNIDGYRVRPVRRRRYLVIGSSEECDRLEALFDKLGIEHNGIFVAHNPDDPDLRSMVHTVDEVVFCSRDIPIKSILDIIQEYSGSGPDFRILPEGMDVLVGGNYISSPEELYTPDFGNIANVTNRRSKRFFDIVSSVVLLVLSPLLFWFQRRKRRFYADCLSVLAGRKSWVGYSMASAGQITSGEEGERGDDEPLPAIRRGVFSTRDRIPKVKSPDCMRLDRSYASEYRIYTDLNILLINIFNI